MFWPLEPYPLLRHQPSAADAPASRKAGATGVNLACIIGNRGADVGNASFSGLANIVALCDTAAGAPRKTVLKMFPDVFRAGISGSCSIKWAGYRRVGVATPDSSLSHRDARYRSGKHVYCEKPMAHSFKALS